MDNYYNEVIEERINRRVGRRAVENVEHFISDDGNTLSDSINSMVDAAQQFSQVIENMQQIKNMSSSLMDFSAGLAASPNDYFEPLNTINQKLAGLNALYSRQIKNLGSQVDAINNINKNLEHAKDLYDSTIQKSGVVHDKAERMSQQLKDLSKAYDKLLAALGENKNFNTNV
jgi:gliding motility-associated protein GldL